MLGASGVCSSRATCCVDWQVVWIGKLCGLANRPIADQQRNARLRPRLARRTRRLSAAAPFSNRAIPSPPDPAEEAMLPPPLILHVGDLIAHLLPGIDHVVRPRDVTLRVVFELADHRLVGLAS